MREPVFAAMSSRVRFVLIAAMLAALAAYALHGRYARYVRDDYCTAISVRERGVIGSMVFFHKTWSGRFSYYLVKGTLEKIGPVTARVLPALLIAGFVAAGIFATGSGLAGVTITFAAFAASPDVLAWGGPLTWETGSITYTLPLILYTVWLGLFRAPSLRRAVFGGLLMLFAGGFSETSLAAQGILAGGALIVTLVLRDRPRAILAAWGLAGSIVALAILATAPGNHVRISGGPVPPPVTDAIVHALGYAHGYFGWSVFVDGKALLAVIAVFALLQSRIEPRVAIALGAVAAAAYVATFLPAAWSLSSSPPPRALHISNYFIVLALACFAPAFGRRFTGAARYAAPVFLLMTVIPLLTVFQVVRRLPDARLEAREIDRIAHSLQSNPGGDVTVHSRWPNRMHFASPDRRKWMNDCLCRFYGAKSVSVMP